MSFAAVYAKGLSTAGHGLPLWHPEPSENAGEVQIGDVGFIHGGAFYRLFNVLIGRDAAVTVDEDEPPATLTYNKKLKAEFPRSLKPGAYMSSSVRSTQLIGHAAIPVAPGADVGLTWSWESTKTEGSILVLQDFGREEVVARSKAFEQYLLQHIDSWYQYATDVLGVVCKPEELLLVHGWIKTTSWNLGAFQSQTQSVGVTISGNISAVAGIGLGLEVTKKNGATFEPRSSPQIASTASLSALATNIINANTSPASSTMPAMLLPELPQNQCVFLSAYRLKYRIPKIWRTVAAAAGYDQLPDADDSDRHDPSATNDSMEREVETEGGPPTFRGPCDILLDYILNNSTAHAAVASEASLNDLLAGKEWPDDLETFLNELCPAIEIDENGYGTLSFEEEIRRTRIRETDYVPDDLDDRAIMRMHEACDSSDRQVLENGKLFLDGSSKPVTWSHIILANNQAEMGSVSAVAVSSQGHHVATGTEDGVVRIWNYKSGKVEVRLEGHEEQVCSLAFSPDGTHIASGSGDFHGMIWDLNDDDDDYAPLHVLEGHDGDVCAITYSPSGTLVATGSMDYTARVWKASDGAHLFTLGRPHTASVLLATFSPDETYLLTCSNNMGYVWDPYSGSLLRTLQGHTDAIWSMSLSPDGQRVVTGSEDLTGRVWSVETGDELVTLREHTGGVWSVGFSPDGKDVVTGSYDSTIVTCDSYTGERHHIFQERPAIVNAVAYSYSGDFIASGSADGCVKVWDTSSGAFVAEFQGHRDKVKSVAWTRDDLNIISSSDDGSVRTWNMRDMLRLV